MHVYIDDKWTEILEPQKFADLVKRNIQYYKDRADRAIKKADKTREEVKSELVNEWEEENVRLRERLALSWGEFDSRKEYDAYTDFCNAHMHDRATSKANGGLQPYIIPTYTGLGCCKTVVCQICGEKQDITDIEVW